MSDDEPFDNEVEPSVRVAVSVWDRIRRLVPREHERYVLCSREIVEQLRANPSEPVTIRIVDADDGRLEMTFTRFAFAGAGTADVPYDRAEVNRVAHLLFDTWKRVDPTSGVAKYPASYIANFADMARAIIADNHARAVESLAVPPTPQRLPNLVPK